MFAVLRKLQWFFTYYWKRYTFAITALMLASAISLVPPELIVFIIYHIRFETLTSSILFGVISLYVAILLTHYIISFLWDYTLFGGAIRLERWMRSSLMDHFLKMTPTFFGRFKTGDLMARSTNDLKAIANTA